MTNKDHFTDLVIKHITGALSDAERIELIELLKVPAYEETLDLIMEESFALSAQQTFGDQANRDRLVTKVIERVGLSLNSTQAVSVVEKKRRRWLTHKSLQYAAAVLVLISTIFGILLWRQKDINQVSQSGNHKITPNLVFPGGDRAILVLANGRQIVLDSADNGNLAEQENASIRKVAKGKVVYEATHADAANAAINTLITPRGGQYQLSLSDGTQVWLNAASRIEFPTTFIGPSREVSISGEVYFEVAHDMN